MTRVLALDPGTTSMGWALLSDEADEVELIDFGALRFEGSEPLIEKLNSIYMLVIKLIQSSACDYLICEKTWRVDRNSLALVAAIKVIKEIVEMTDIDSSQALAVSVRKQFGCGARDSATAKAKTQAYVVNTFGISNDLVSDVYDAVLLGYYALQTD